jgi:sulfur-carrier protein adenylyltransferase/sulfurtransferase
VFNYEGGPTYRCLYPEAPNATDRPNCSETGVMGVLPGIVGTLQANEVIKLITGIGSVLSGKLLSFDALHISFQLFDFELDIKNKAIYKLEDTNQLCADPFVISATELKNKQQYPDALQLIDVRNPEEHELYNITGQLIPMDEIRSNIHLISRNKPVVVYCQRGNRSNTVVSLLRNEFGFENVVSLSGGIEAY